MTRKEILDRASTVLPALTRYYNDQGAYVEGEGDILSEYVAKVLIEDYDPDPDLGNAGIIAHLTAILEQAIVDLTQVCEALESYDVPGEEAFHG
jgi:hypothetical protein